MQADSPNPKQLSKLTSAAENALALLKTDRAFWDDLVERLDAVAASHINRWAWFGGHKPLPEHLAADAIDAILLGQWVWKPTDPVKESLFRKCSQVIWSRVNQELEKSKKFRVAIKDENADRENEFNTGRQVATPKWVDSPVEALLAAENWSELISLLPTEDSEPNRLLCQLVEEIAFSNPIREEVAADRKPGWSNLELAKKLHVTVDAIENAKKRLRTILDAWLWKVFVEDLPDDGRPWNAFVDIVGSSNLRSNWKTVFAERHSMGVTQVDEMGVDLIDRINNWRERTLPNVGVLDRAANRITKSFNK